MITVNIGSEVNTMSADLDRAKELLSTGQYTCVLCRGEAIRTSTSRGVRPLLELLDSGKSYQDFSASDKVVGKATAFLYILLGIREIHAQVISKAFYRLEISKEISALSCLQHSIGSKFHSLCKLIFKGIEVKTA